MPPLSSRLKEKLYVLVGTVFLVIGIVGIVVPVLPTTPLLLLAAICYMRGSRKLYDALLGNRYIGSYLRDYLEGKGMSLKMKIWTLTLLWVAIICTALFATTSLAVRIILGSVLIGVTVHILLLKTSGSERGS